MIHVITTVFAGARFEIKNVFVSFNFGFYFDFGDLFFLKMLFCFLRVFVK